MPDTNGNIATMAANITYIQRDVAEIKGKLNEEYVTHQEFEPIKNLVYGMVALILTGFVGALIALVVKN